MELFGFSINKKKKDEGISEVEPSVIQPEIDDGTQVSESALASYYGYTVDLDGSTKNEIQAIQTTRYLL